MVYEGGERRVGKESSGVDADSERGEGWYERVGERRIAE